MLKFEMKEDRMQHLEMSGGVTQCITIPRSEMEMPKLTAREIMAALRCCGTNDNEGGGCRNCPLEHMRSRFLCSEQACILGADLIGRLLDATEGICQREQDELIRRAGECNTAVDRGLHGVSDAHFAVMHQHQTVLAALGREVIIRAEPVKEKGWRVRGVAVDGVPVFGEMEQRDGGA